MIILISFLGLIRNFKKTSHLFLNTIFNNNPDITFHILFHTSTFSSQISKKKEFNISYFDNNEIKDILLNSPISKKYKVIDLIFKDFIDVTYPGLFFDRIIDIKSKIDLSIYDFAFFLRFDSFFKEPIKLGFLDKNIVYFFNGNNTSWYIHNKDIDYALLTDPITLGLFLKHTTTHFYRDDFSESFYTYSVIYSIFNNLDSLPFHSRWKIYNDHQKDNIVREIINIHNHKKKYNCYNKKIYGSEELLCISYYLLDIKASFFPNIIGILRNI